MMSIQFERFQISQRNTKSKMEFRNLFAILGCFGMAIIYGFKVNLSVAIVAMVNQTALKEDTSADDEHNISITDANDNANLVCSPPMSGENHQPKQPVNECFILEIVALHFLSCVSGSS